MRRLWIGLEQRKLVGWFLLAFLLFSCRTSQSKETVPQIPEPPQEEQPLVESALEVALGRLRQAYQPASCFRAGFLVEAGRAGEEPQVAKGVLRVDNEKKRMHFIFTDQYLGITLSRITVFPDKVYISDTRSKREVLPLKTFQVRGLGFNNIQLPFPLLQDLLFARLPEEIFSDRAELQLEGEKLSAEFSDRKDRYRYEFEQDRLRRLTYRSGVAMVRVDLHGRYGKTIFPARIGLSSGGDRMAIRFQSLNLKARCKDSYFPKL